MPHFTPDLAHPQTLVWRVRRADYSGRITLYLFLLFLLWFTLSLMGEQMNRDTTTLFVVIVLLSLLYCRHAVYDILRQPPLAVCDPQGLILYGYYGTISHQWRWDALQQVTASCGATWLETFLSRDHAILHILPRDTAPRKLRMEGLRSETHALAHFAQRYIDGETPVPVAALPADWQRVWYKHPDLVQRGNLNHFWLLLPLLLLLKMAIAAGKHLNAATAGDIVFYIPLWCITAMAATAVGHNLRHNFCRRREPPARADSHGLHLALRRCLLPNLYLLYTGPLNTHLPWQTLSDCERDPSPFLSSYKNYTQHIGLTDRHRHRRIIITECLGKNDAPSDDLCATIRAILDGSVPPAAAPYPPLRVRPFAWCVLAANSGYALALCGGLLPVWTFFIATFANLVILALPWQWQAAFTAPDC